ncbi:MAG: hypothetical protein JSU68_12420 [Phycisphaerales bacterium]|nr:MAG: hypothetical protein JSU68_12420 [Phycisphaerales bacterium]
MRPILTLLAAFAILAAGASARAGTIDLIVNAFATHDGGTPWDPRDDVVTPIATKCGDPNLTSVEPGSIITYEIAVAVDPAAAHPLGNMGLATMVFDVLKCDPSSTYYVMPCITAAETGYTEWPSGGIGGLRDFANPMYFDSASTEYPGYNGGWGWEGFGLPVGGNVTSSPGAILGAGLLALLVWDADVNPTYPGNQPFSRLGIGHGTYVFPDDDPACGGLQGGFGQDLSNASNVIPGDGHWLQFRGSIDTSGWTAGAVYGWDIVPTNGAVYSPTVDYNVDVGGGFRIGVSADDMTGDSFSFRLLSECDVDRDGDVDLNDFATFSVCFYGTSVTVPPAGCTPEDFAASDFDEDGDVDLSDLATFAVEFTG